ncbi:hypothetical protein CLOSTHATH_00736 [Hungatella hathewayi DSM 13479]|uniref:Uncharacterized protein n=1 Tax=Hungatella hathewayi DSM 13479 TaxID=566550 RepID=D3AAW5_9FIRM|nr:hypothetical protein CLOSTHATH_00736 [Hungatella hathewayi DSM 13479]
MNGAAGDFCSYEKLYGRDPSGFMTGMELREEKNNWKYSRKTSIIVGALSRGATDGPGPVFSCTKQNTYEK